MKILYQQFKDKAKIEIEAEVIDGTFGFFAICQDDSDDDLWMVIHIPTGCRCFRGHASRDYQERKTRKVVITFNQELLTYCDDDFIRSQIDKAFIEEIAKVAVDAFAYQKVP